MSDHQVASSNIKAYPITFSVDYPEKLSGGQPSSFILVIPVYIWSQLFIIHFNK